MRNCKRQICFNSDKGLTLIEIIIVLTILIIILTMGFQVYHHINNTFKEGEKQWVAQREAQKLIDWFDSNLKNSYELLIYDDDTYTGTTHFDSDDKYLYIYNTDNQKVYFRNSYENEPQLLTEAPVNVLFSVDTDYKDTSIKALDYSVSILDSDDSSVFELNSTVSFVNMLRSSGVNRINGKIQTDTKSQGNMIKFLNETSNLNSIEIRTESCFIATAAFGTYNQTPVRILRQFRDKFLLTNKPGQLFVKFYYKNSPPIAKFIANKPVLKYIVCIALLPLILLAFILLVPQTIILVIYMLSFLVIVGRTILHRGKLSKT